MESTIKRNIKDRSAFSKYILPAKGKDMLVKKGATLKDTMALIPSVVPVTLEQTKKFAQLFKRETRKETCNAIWQWMYDHIEFVKDEQGKEQIKSPSRTFADGYGDCDDYTVFISSILTNLSIPNLFRIAEYNEVNGFQHIYSVAKDKDKTEIIIDPVTEKFNYEVPYIQKKDTYMDLYYLNGLEKNTEGKVLTTIDAEDLMGTDVGKLFNFKDNKLVKKITDTKVVTKLKEGIHTVNKINPATALLRTGMLAAMKMNMFGIASKMRYAYLNEAEAKKRGINLTSFGKLKTIHQKLIKLFHGAGGDEKNLKTAILTGKGNSGNDVPLNGLGYIDRTTYSENSPLANILGDEIYNSEVLNVEGLSGTLGEPVTAAALASATTILAAVAQLLKSIGPLKPGQGDSSVSETENSDNNTGNDAGTNSTTTDPNSGGEKQNPVPQTDTPAENQEVTTDLPEMDTKSVETATNSSTTNTVPAARNSSTEGAWTTIKEWVKKNPVGATAIGVVVVGGISYGVYRLVKAGKSKSKNNLSGIPKKKHHKGKKKQNNEVRYMRLK
jgi:hypothetical protein